VAILGLRSTRSGCPIFVYAIPVQCCNIQCNPCRVRRAQRLGAPRSRRALLPRSGHLSHLHLSALVDCSCETRLSDAFAIARSAIQVVLYNTAYLHLVRTQAQITPRCSRSYASGPFSSPVCWMSCRAVCIVEVTWISNSASKEYCTVRRADNAHLFAE
jgi:hypothetical protein